MNNKNFIPFFITASLLIGYGYPSWQKVDASPKLPSDEVLALSPHRSISPPSRPSVLIAQSIWKPFSSQEGRFRILMPGTPMQDKTPVNTRAGSIPVNVFAVVRPEAFYLVAYSDFPKAITLDSPEVKELLPQVDPNVAKRDGVRIVSQSNLRLRNYPGREIKMQDREGVVFRWRAFIVNKRLYQIGVITDKESSLTKSIEGFFKSFQFLDDPSAPRKPTLEELGKNLSQSVCSQNWKQALNLLNQMIAIAPNAEVRDQFTDYRRQIQNLANSGEKIPPESLPDCATGR
jgi:hypothetical protein